MKTTFFSAALVLLLSSCHRQIFDYVTDTGWETIEFHNENHFIWQVKRAKGRYSYKGRYHFENDTTLTLDFLPVRRGANQLWIDEGLTAARKIAPRADDYLIHLSSYLYVGKLPELRDPISYDNLRVYAGPNILWEGDSSPDGKCTFRTTQRPDRLVYFHERALTNVVHLALDEPSEYQLQAHIPYLPVNRGGDGCGMPDRGPYYKLSFIQKDKQVVEIFTRSSHPKVYRLRRKVN